jgi:nitroreductase
MHEPTHMLDLIKRRRTIHRYLERAVPPELVWEALDAAHHAPNHLLTWPWRFYVVGAQTKAALDSAALKQKEVNGTLEGAELEAFKEKRLNAHLIVVSQVRSEDPTRAKEDYAAVSCAIQNLCLTFAARGVGSKWSTGSLTRAPQLYELLDIDARAEEVVGFVWYGYPAQVPSVERPELDMVVRLTP